jgi:Xaa-Pro aminopeptidase
MILSNEPGYYLRGAYGIRLENLVLVQPAEFPQTERKFLRFETLTLAPFDRALIDPTALPAASLIWLNQYHTRVRETLTPFLDTQQDAAALEWLRAATAPI